MSSLLGNQNNMLANDSPNNILTHRTNAVSDVAGPVVDGVVGSLRD